MATTTPAYSFAQLEQLARSVGLSATDAQVAAAIAMAESRGETRAISSTGDYGLWQINARWHPEFDRQLLLGANYNARAMAKIFQGSGWGPWSTYKSGRYRSFMPASSGSSSSSSSGGGGIDLTPGFDVDLTPGFDVPDLTPGFDVPSISGVADQVLGKVTLLMFGLLLSGAGLAILALGLNKFANNSATVQEATTTAGNVASVAALAAV